MEDAINSQRAIVYFLWKRGIKAADIVRQLESVFGASALQKTAVYKWIERFKGGRESLEDDDRSGRPAEAITKANINAVEEVVMNDRRVTIAEIEAQVGISEKSIRRILHDHLQMTKLSAVWVPKLLGPAQRADRVSISQELLALEESYGKNFWRRIITVDESWLPYFNPETKEQSKEWRRRGEGPPIKARRVPSVGKVMITVFWDCDGIILIDYLPKGRTINSEYYSGLLKGPLRKALKEKRPGKLRLRPLLQQDNARPHTARQTIDTIADLRWELLPHPAYSPDLAPSDYHLFGELKDPLRGIHFESLKAIQKAVNDWILGTPQKFFENGLKKLVPRWHKCIELKGDYIEKRDLLDND